MKRIGLVFLALVVALGSLGAAYAMWKDEVFVTSVVNTGNVSVSFLAQASNDPPPGPPPYLNAPLVNQDPAGSHWPLGDGSWAWSNWDLSDAEWFGTRYEKNVAYTVCDFDNATNSATITLNNAYPSYGPDVLFAFTNDGTIPVVIYAVKLVSVTTDAGTFYPNLDIDVNHFYTVNADGSIETDAQTGDDNIYQIVLSSLFAQPLLNQQIEPGENFAIDVGCHVSQEASQNAQYSFVVAFLFCNYNE